MLRALFSSVASLSGHQMMLDVIANNIANVNTTGFKSGSMTFQDMISQTIRPAQLPGGDRGAINPMQVGLGVIPGSISVDLTQGQLMSTDKTTDIAIQGNGLLIFRQGNGYTYSRDGSLSVDPEGYISNGSTGLKLQGWLATDGVLDTHQQISDIQLPMTSMQISRLTSEIRCGGNLNAGAATYSAGPPATGGITSSTSVVYDSLGMAHPVDITFTKDVAANSWSWSAVDETSTTVGSGTLVFDSEGSAVGATGTITLNLTNGAQSPQAVTLNFGSVQQMYGDSEVLVAYQDGAPPGSLQDFQIASDGTITGTFSNGLTRILGQIAMASFTNPSGLVREGNNLYYASTASGDPSIGEPASGDRGQLFAGMLEMSNVDMAREFSQMIIAQRGFQANSRVVTATDQILQELMSMKR